ncbi:MAG: aminotransferase class V-fold PLP-dependent enzyme [Clostridia bacterium]|nr:aminotransferase class V-fold PLP-dependent enzyme [Clostridia bacterium]
MEEKRFVYADNAATTPVAAEVLNKMMPYLTGEYGNPSASFYGLGQRAKRAIEEARGNVAQVLNASPKEIFFTGSGTEADNMALRWFMHSETARGRKKLLTTTIEHHAILHTAKALEKEGFSVVYLPVDNYGTLDLNALENAIDEDTALVSVMTANNEVGTIQPVEKIGKICHEKGVYFHTDAVQAFGHIKLDVKAMNIDLLSLSGHKINATKGVGAIYIRSGLALEPLITGGGQEKNRRSGTENVPAIVGLGEAARLKGLNMERESAYVTSLSKSLQEKILKTIPQTVLTGHPENRLPGNSSFAIAAIEGETMVMDLDLNGICAATGSACSTASLDPSHVLLAIGLSHETAHGSLRITLDTQNTPEDVDYIAERLAEIVKRRRAMSPVWKEQ